MFQADETKFRDFNENPNQNALSADSAFSVRSFPRQRAFSGHTYYKMRAAFTFPARAAGMRQTGCAYRKAWLSAAQKLFYAHAFLGELTPAERRDLRKTPTKTRIKRCAFSVRSFPRLLVASRRHGRRRALLAALPVAPAAPLSQKSRSSAIFGKRRSRLAGRASRLPAKC